MAVLGSGADTTSSATTALGPAAARRRRGVRWTAVLVPGARPSSRGCPADPLTPRQFWAPPMKGRDRQGNLLAVAKTAPDVSRRAQLSSARSDIAASQTTP